MVVWFTGPTLRVPERGSVPLQPETVGLATAVALVALLVVHARFTVLPVGTVIVPILPFTVRFAEVPVFMFTVTESVAVPPGPVQVIENVRLLVIFVSVFDPLVGFGPPQPEVLTVAVEVQLVVFVVLQETAIELPDVTFTGPFELFTRKSTVGAAGGGAPI